MDDPRELHRRAGEMAARLIDQTAPDQLGLPTPCSQWDVSALINHLVSANLRVAAMLGGRTGPDRGADVLGNDPAGRFRSSFADLAAVFDEEGFLDRTVPTMFGESPGRQLVAIRITDLTTHCWDLAVATRQPRDLDPALVAFATTMLRARPLPRGEDAPFGAEQPAPQDASAADQLAAFAGRAVPASA
jgi:uncharacterized protein (TIGR03086 family)